MAKHHDCVAVQIHLPPELHARLRLQAAEQRRSVRQQALWLLGQALGQDDEGASALEGALASAPAGEVADV
jgi:plasmid stability protein